MEEVLAEVMYPTKILAKSALITTRINNLKIFFENNDHEYFGYIIKLYIRSRTWSAKSETRV